MVKPGPADDADSVPGNLKVVLDYHVSDPDTVVADITARGGTKIEGYDGPGVAWTIPTAGVLPIIQRDDVLEARVYQEFALAAVPTQYLGSLGNRPAGPIVVNHLSYSDVGTWFIVVDSIRNLGQEDRAAVMPHQNARTNASRNGYWANHYGYQ